MKNFILLFILIISGIIRAQNNSFITSVNIPQKDLINCNFYKEFSKIKNDSCFYEFIEIAEIKNINRIKNNLSPLYLKKDRINILKIEYYHYPINSDYYLDSSENYVNDSTLWNDLVLSDSDSIRFLLKFIIEDSLIQCSLLGVDFIFNEKIEKNKLIQMKRLYYDWNDLKVSKMFNFSVPFDFEFNIDKQEFVYLEYAIIGYQDNLYKGYFSFDYFKKYTLEKFLFLEELNKLYVSGKFNLLFSVENSKLKIDM